MVNQLYQDANNSEYVDVQFKSSKIKLTTGKSVGWKCEISPDHRTVILIRCHVRVLVSECVGHSVTIALRISTQSLNRIVSHKQLSKGFGGRAV